MKLYELTEELEQLQSMLIESGGEITEELEELMGRNEAAVKDKMKGYIMVIRQLKARGQAMQQIVLSLTYSIIWRLWM